MASSCSFIYDRKLVTDSICYASISRLDKETYAIIEKKKFYFKRKQIEEFLTDLQSMELDFTFRYQTIKSRIILDVSKVIGKTRRLFLFTAIRCFWEGTYPNKGYDPDDNESFWCDNFVEVIGHYFNIKKYLPKEKSKLLLLCLATNCYVKGNSGRYSGNHFFVSTNACKLRKTLRNIDESYSLNSYFTGSHFMTEDLSLKAAHNWNEEDYINVFTKLKYDYKKTI